MAESGCTHGLPRKRHGPCDGGGPGQRMDASKVSTVPSILRA